ncbi:MAG: class I SAM-dependent methyltransferase [Thermodesulfobacteriota bacterium]
MAAGVGGSQNHREKNMHLTYNQENREKWLEQTLKKIPAGLRILDAGAGELKYKKFCSHLQYVSQDFGQYDGTGDGAGLHTEKWDQTRLDIVSDIISIPELDGAFDAVMCIEVLEHVPRPDEALRELARLLRPGGFLVLTAPFASLTHMAPYFFQTGYSRYFYQHWFEKLNLEILDLQENGNYFDYLAQELYRLPSVAIRYSSDSLTWLENKALNIVNNALGRFSVKDAGSSEFLCFGIHILARKK